MEGITELKGLALHHNGKDTKISLFQNAFLPENPQIVSIYEALDRIKNGESKEIIEKIRNEPDEAKQKELKNRLPATTFNAEFLKYRAGKNTDKYKGEIEFYPSGVIILDWDHFDAIPEQFKRHIFSYNFILAAWLSPRNGVKALARITQLPPFKSNGKPVTEDSYKNFTEIYRAISKEFKDLDESGKDIARLCFESYDPKILIREWDETEVFSYSIKDEPTPSTTQYEGEHWEYARVRLRDAAEKGNKHTELYNVAKWLVNHNQEPDEVKEFLRNEISQYDLKSKTQAFKTINEGIDAGLKRIEGNDIDNLIQECIYNINSEFEQPEPLILIGDFWFGTLGNFSMITGKAKSMKTFLITLLMGFVLKVYNIIGLIKGQFPEGRENIGIFDTEQAGFHAHKVIQRVKELGGNADRITGYKLRPFPPQTRLDIIQRVIETTHKTTALYIIDGIRDIAQKGINDEETATILTSKFLEWTDKYKIHIIVVLHQNKGDNNPRGHLGTEVMNKAETVAATVKEGEITIVNCEQARNRAFEPFAFEIINGLPQLTEIPGKESNNSKINPELVAEKTHKNIIDRIFEARNEYSNEEIRTAIINEFNKVDQGFGQTKAKEFVMYYETNKYIQNIGKQVATAKKIWVKCLVNEL